MSPGIPAAGEVIAERYVVEDVLGSGGMGLVVAARHVQLGQPLAIKFLYPEMAARAEVVARFMREARATASIQSEHVARVYDVGTLPSGAPYMVMERLVGSDLEKVAKTRGPLPIAETVGYVLEACEAIAEAHAQGIVHRDLKTANIFVAQRPDGTTTVKVLDFGISKMTDSAVGLTGTATTLGSPSYISPEQIQSTKSVDHRTDIWALGVILHRSLTGSWPFDAEQILGVLRKILEDPAPPLRSLRPDAPEALEAAVLRCLEKSLDRRTRDVADLAIELLPFAPPGAQGSVERIVKALRGPGATVTAPATHDPLPFSETMPVSMELEAPPVSQAPLSQVPLSQAPLSQAPLSQAPLSQAAGDGSAVKARAAWLRTIPMQSAAPALPAAFSSTIPIGPPLSRPGVDAAPPSVPVPHLAPAVAAKATPTMATATPPARKSNLLIVAIVVAVCVVLGVGLGVMVARRGTETPGTPSAIPTVAPSTTALPEPSTTATAAPSTTALPEPAPTVTATATPTPTPPRQPTPVRAKKRGKG
ncbi:MAG: protein kinase [Minicystis sp.]